MLIKIPHKQINGFTLIELLIALAINAIVFTVLIAVFANTLNRFSNSLKLNRLNQQLEIAMQTMVGDIRRAGYWGNAISNIGAATNTNPFMSSSSGTDIQTPSSSCILFTADQNSDGLFPVISTSTNDERLGFRLNNQILQARPRGVAFDCLAAASAWENVTDPNVVLITGLTFTLNQTVVTSSGVHTLILRSVDITLTGQLKVNSTITKTITQHVKVRNDKFTP